MKTQQPVELSLLFKAKNRQTFPIDEKSEKIQLHYERTNGKLFLGNSIDWLKSSASESIDLVFADPPYNIKKANWDNFETQEIYVAFQKA